MSKSPATVAVLAPEESASDRFAKWLRWAGYEPHVYRPTDINAGTTTGAADIALLRHDAIVSYLPKTAEVVTDQLLMQVPEDAVWLQCAPIAPPMAESLVLRARRAGVHMLHMRYMTDPITTTGRPTAVVYGRTVPADGRAECLINAVTGAVDWIGPLKTQHKTPAPIHHFRPERTS